MENCNDTTIFNLVRQSVACSFNQTTHILKNSGTTQLTIGVTALATGILTFRHDYCDTMPKEDKAQSRQRKINMFAFGAILVGLIASVNGIFQLYIAFKVEPDLSEMDRCSPLWV